VGFDFGHLLFGRIAVVLEAVDRAGLRHSIAIADLKRESATAGVGKEQA
jgi:hypothetical protein